MKPFCLTLTVAVLTAIGTPACAQNEVAAAPEAAAAAESSNHQLVLREISLRTFSGTINDEDSHPVLIIDDLKRPRPIGPGRGAGGYVFLNNRLYSWEDNRELGMMRGMCFTIDHGDAGPWTGEVAIGLGGPFPSSCQLYYELPGGTLTANGLIDLNAMEKDVSIPVPITGGTGEYMGARGQVNITQDPPGQPITYRITLEYSLP